MGDRTVSKRSRHPAFAAAAVLALSVLCAATPAQATNCTQVPLTVTVNPVPLDQQANNGNGGYPGIYGDLGPVPAPPNTNTGVYTDGVDGVTAFFNVCPATNPKASPTYKFGMNLTNSGRFLNLEFSRRLTSYDSGAIVPGINAPVVLSAGTVGIPLTQAYSTSGQFVTFGDAGSINMSGNPYLYYCNPSTFACSTAAQIAANKYSPTSLLQVTVNCPVPPATAASWTIIPLVPVNTPSVAGLTESFKPGKFVSAGNYSMPFSFTITRKDMGGCSGLP